MGIGCRNEILDYIYLGEVSNTFALERDDAVRDR